MDLVTRRADRLHFIITFQTSEYKLSRLDIILLLHYHNILVRENWAYQVKGRTFCLAIQDAYLKVFEGLCEVLGEDA